MSQGFKEILIKLLYKEEKAHHVDMTDVLNPVTLNSCETTETYFNFSTQRISFKGNYKKYNISKPVSHSIKTPSEKKPYWSPAQILAIENFRRLGAHELTLEATVIEIKRAFRKLAKKWHPDSRLQLTTSQIKERAIQFQSLKESYDLLQKEFHAISSVFE